MMALLSPQVLLAKFGVYIAIAAGVLVAYATWHKKVENAGIRKEQVRVEAVGKKIDAAAQKKREKIERAPPSEVDNALRKYCRDCGP